MYEANLAEQVRATVRAARKMTARETGMASDRLAQDMQQADEAVASGR